MIDLVVEGNAYLDGRIEKCCIGIEDGTIVAIKKILKGEHQLDFGDKLILPGGIDLHVHFQDPGYTAKEDFSTGTIAAAFGGISCVFDMPNTEPFVISKERLAEKLKIVAKKAYIDFGLYSTLTEKTNIEQTAKACSAFKIFLGTTTGNLVFSNLTTLSSTLYSINQTGRIPAVHAEFETILRQRSTSKSPKNLHEHLLVRPNEAEANAVANLIGIAESWFGENGRNNRKDPPLEHSDQPSGQPGTRDPDKQLTVGWLINSHKLAKQAKNQNNVSGTLVSSDHQIGYLTTLESNAISKHNQTQNKITHRIQPLHIHICHVSTGEGVKLLNDFTQAHPFGVSSQTTQPVMITSEVTPHHLLLNETSDLGGFCKVNPPLRREEDSVALWSAFCNGTIQILASDHAPHTIDEKSGEFAAAPSGIPGVETMLPLMLSAHKHHRVSLDRLVPAVTTIPAWLHGLPKGRLAVGNDGDLIVVDFYKEKPIKTKDLHSKCGWTPYEKMDAIFPILTVVRGNIVVKDGNLEGDAGIGRYYN